MLDNLIRDIKLGARSLLRDKVFCRDGGADAGHLYGSVYRHVCNCEFGSIAPPALPNADAIVLMANLYPKAGVNDQNVSGAPDYYDRLRAVTTLQDQAMFDQIDTTLEINGTAQQVPGMEVTPSFFKLVGIAPARGTGPLNAR